MGRAGRTFEPFFRAIREDIFKFCEAWNWTPTWQQREFLQAVQDATFGRGKTRIAAKSGQGPGKTTASVMAGSWRAIRNYGSLTMVTAPTMKQCMEVWLTEARLRLADADPMLQRIIEITKTRIILFGDPDWGVKFVTATKPQNAQGRHRPHMTWIAEEASGVARPIIEQIDGTLTNEDPLFIQIGNPNTRDCAFFDCFNIDRHMWKTMTFNAEESPICNKATHVYLAEKYGRESDVYRIRVLGEFPHKDPTCVMSSEDIEACSKVDIYRMIRMPRTLSGMRPEPAKQIGLDFAAFGGDETVIYRRLGEAVVEQYARSRVDPLDAVSRTLRMQKDAKWKNEDTWFVPDCNGIGDGVVGQYYKADRQIFEFRSNHVSSDAEYDNRNTEAWFALADKVKHHKIYIPRDDDLIQQLSSRQYDSTKKGKIILEEKKHYRQRGFTSPDRADALVMTFYDGVTAVATMRRKANAGKRVGIEVA